jgi:Tol biopolymer transport system component
VPARDGRASTWRHWAVAIVLMTVGAVAGSLLTRARAPDDSVTPRTVPMHLAVDVPLALEEAPAFALSRDGTMLAFVGGSNSSRKLYVRRIDADAATVIAGTDGASSPFFSPDGQWLAFVANESLRKVRISGGVAPVRLAVATDRGGIWTDDNTIVYVQDRTGGLFQIPADGGTPTQLTRVDADGLSHRFPSWIRESQTVLFTVRTKTPGASAIFALDLKTKRQTTVRAGAYHPVYSEPGRLLFMRDSTLFSAPFDIERLTITGPETQVTNAVRAIPDVLCAQFATAGRVLLYQPGTEARDTAVMVWRSIDGRETPLMSEPDSYRDPRFSPDGRRLAYSVLPAGSGTDVWVFDRTRALKTRVTYDATLPEWWPIWTPDGRSIAYSDNLGIRLIRADGSGERQTLSENTQSQIPMSFSPGGAHLAYTELHRETQGDIWVLPLEPKGQARPFVKTPFHEQFPVFSPNGRWIAYGSNESGTFEVYVRPFPEPGPKYQISGDQSFDVHAWSSDGTKLFYRSGDGRRMMSVPVRTDRAEFEFGKPSVLFELDPEQYPDMQFWGSFAAAPDGSGFAMVKRVERDQSARTHLMLILDWR